MITIISHWFNEELLAPLFFKHYSYVDKIIILLDKDTDDKTREICSRYPNIEVKEVESGGNDDRRITDNKNKEISNIKDGWIYVVDADEFIFPEGFEDVDKFLNKQTTDVVKTLNFHVYRHVTEKDIDYDREIIPQRIHGRRKRMHRDWFIKPSVFRASASLQVTIGSHDILGEHTVSNERYIGAHWKLADKEIAVRRRLSNKERMSQANMKRGYSKHEYNITEEKIIEDLKRSENLPVLDLLTSKMDEYGIRSKVIIDSLKDKKGLLTGVEIGVYKGDMICSLLDLEPRIEKIYGIDPYACSTEYRRRWTQSNWDFLYEIVMKKLSKYEDRVFMIRDKSEVSWDAIPMVDFVEIDGGHSYHQVAKDIELYDQKVNKGGVLCGHDYFGKYARPVRQAVNGYAGKHGRNICEDESAGMWWWRV